MTRSTACAGALICLVSILPAAAETDREGHLDPAAAAQRFQEFADTCSADDGKLWGVSLCGPLLLVDPATRHVVGNRPGGDGLLEPRDGVFVGRLPEDVGIANTAMEWGGTRWTMIIRWALGGDAPSRRSLMAHEAFHRIQPELDLVVFGEMNAHLDTADGRFWMQLEWNALQRALEASGEERQTAVADGLSFRAARHARFPAAIEREVPLEIFEGLAEYTGMRLAGFSPEDVLRAVETKRANDSGFVRSFAYVSGPLYGYLLDAAAPGWRARVGPTTDLGDLLTRAYEIAPGSTADASRRAGRHGGDALRASEDERAARREAQLAVWRKALIEGPVLAVDLGSVSSGSFDPRKVYPFDDGRTVFTVRTLIAEWGVLEVDAGAILENDAAGLAHVSLAGATDDGRSGEGWTLRLEPGWKIVPGERPGDLRVVKERAAEVRDAPYRDE